MGNIVANEKGEADVDITDHLITLSTGKNSILYRAIVVHELKDDLGLGNNNASITTGNAGPRLACGTIQAKNSSPSTSMCSFVKYLCYALVIIVVFLEI